MVQVFPGVPVFHWCVAWNLSNLTNVSEISIECFSHSICLLPSHSNPNITHLLNWIELQCWKFPIRFHAHSLNILEKFQIMHLSCAVKCLSFIVIHNLLNFLSHFIDVILVSSQTLTNTTTHTHTWTQTHPYNHTLTHAKHTHSNEKCMKFTVFFFCVFVISFHSRKVTSKSYTLAHTHTINSKRSKWQVIKVHKVPVLCVNCLEQYIL